MVHDPPTSRTLEKYPQKRRAGGLEGNTGPVRYWLTERTIYESHLACYSNSSPQELKLRSCKQPANML